MITPEQFKNEQFELSVLGGYKREQVDAFFASVAADYEKLYKENSDLIQKLKLCASKIEEYQKEEQYLKTAILNAEKLNENSLRDIERREKEIESIAREKAENIVEKAKIDAENILKTARLEAADAIKECEAETAEKIAEFKSAQEAEEKILNSLKKEVSDFKDMVYKIYRKHINSLSKIPDFTEPQPVTTNEEPVEPETKVEAEPEQQTVDNVVEPVAEAEPELEKVEVLHNSTGEKTTEFVINKTSVPSNEEEEIEKNFKFKGLKFGTDFDIRKQD